MAIDGSIGRMHRLESRGESMAGREEGESDETQEGDERGERMGEHAGSAAGICACQGEVNRVKRDCCETGRRVSRLGRCRDKETDEALTSIRRKGGDRGSNGRYVTDRQPVGRRTVGVGRGRRGRVTGQLWVRDGVEGD
jgi:hypothetical protein